MQSPGNLHSHVDMTDHQSEAEAHHAVALSAVSSSAAVAQQQEQQSGGQHRTTVQYTDSPASSPLTLPVLLSPAGELPSHAQHTQQQHLHLSADSAAGQTDNRPSVTLPGCSAQHRQQQHQHPLVDSSADHAINSPSVTLPGSLLKAEPSPQSVELRQQEDHCAAFAHQQLQSGGDESMAHSVDHSVSSSNVTLPASLVLKQEQRLQSHQPVSYKTETQKGHLDAASDPVQHLAELVRSTSQSTTAAVQAATSLAGEFP